MQPSNAAVIEGPLRSVDQTVERCRELTGLGSRAKLYKWMSAGQLAYVQLDGRRLIPEGALLEFIATKYVPAANQGSGER